jgi:aerobic C4-dicarboxylate transport protein
MQSIKSIFSNLTFWVLISIFLGIAVGHFAPQLALYEVLSKDIKFNFIGSEIKMGKSIAELLSGCFISIVKLFINPIIFITISLGIIQMGDLKKVGRLGAKALIYFEVVTTFALVIGVAAAYLIKPGHGIVQHSNHTDINKYTKGAAEFNWSNFLMENVTLQVLLISLIFGVFISKSSYQNTINKRLTSASSFVFKVLHRIMLLAPVGAFGGMAYTIAKYGLKSLMPLAKLMATVYVTMACFILLVLAVILWQYRISLFKFLNYMREELLIVLGTSSSEAALPNLMEKLERMGCSKSVVGLVVPTGYSFNLDGTTIYLSMAVIFLAQVFQVQLDLGQLFTVIGILMITSKGAAGVTGSGFIVLASTLSAVNIIPVEGLALLLGVDRFMSEARALTNFIGNGVATIWLANHEKAFDRSAMVEAFSNLTRSEDIHLNNLD